ncbi:hypothetical protein K5549_010525 [Capra hircus]|nr:hypothetical protein K5549_010525 [Capra hircus]
MNSSLVQVSLAMAFEGHGKPDCAQRCCPVLHPGWPPRPMGIFSIFPKATNATFKAALYNNHLEATKPQTTGRENPLEMVQSDCTEQWNKLMTTLHGTSPHSVCCIVPHEFKKSGTKDAHLIMHQLACNGILEGLQICRKGFPDRLQYAEFTQRGLASELLLGSINLDVNEYKIGHTK